jgi:hypothetical protein
MNPLKTIAAALIAALISFPALAGPYANAASQCMADRTTGKDRKDLAKWIFIAMGAHPDIRNLSAASGTELDSSSRTVGALFSRLIAENCAGEFSALVANEGSESIGIAFEFLGKLAMRELMTDSEVSAALAGFEKYIDRPKVSSVLTPKQNGR